MINKKTIMFNNIFVCTWCTYRSKKNYEVPCIFCLETCTYPSLWKPVKTCHTCTHRNITAYTKCIPCGTHVTHSLWECAPEFKEYYDK